MKVTKTDINKIKPETCWMIAWGKNYNGGTGFFLPWITGRTRKDVIKEALKVYVSETWEELHKDGLRAVKVTVSVVKMK